jgi:hypothetical protein
MADKVAEETGGDHLPARLPRSEIKDVPFDLDRHAVEVPAGVEAPLRRS